MRPAPLRLATRPSGHGELLILLGFALAVGVGADAFDQVGLKPDLGALIVGLTLATHRRAGELAETLLGFKDILLIGFFLSIGLGGAPGPAALAVSAIVLLLLPAEDRRLFAPLTRFRLRARTSWHASVDAGQLQRVRPDRRCGRRRSGHCSTSSGPRRSPLQSPYRLRVAAPVNTARYAIYQRWSSRLGSLERSPIVADDALIEPGDASVIVFGMGRVGAGAYDELVRRRGNVVLGVDRSEEIGRCQRAAGRRIVRGDALDIDFWDRIRLHPGIDLVVSRHETTTRPTSRASGACRTSCPTCASRHQRPLPTRSTAARTGRGRRGPQSLRRSRPGPRRRCLRSPRPNGARGAVSAMTGTDPLPVGSPAGRKIVSEMPDRPPLAVTTKQPVSHASSESSRNDAEFMQ